MDRRIAAELERPLTLEASRFGACGVTGFWYVLVVFWRLLPVCGLVLVLLNVISSLGPFPVCISPDCSPLLI